MRSVIHIAPELLGDLLPLFDLAGVKIVGSEKRDTAIALLVEGDAIPDAPLIECVVDRVLANHVMQVTMRFRAAYHDSDKRKMEMQYQA